VVRVSPGPACRSLDRTFVAKLQAFRGGGDDSAVKWLHDRATGGYRRRSTRRPCPPDQVITKLYSSRGKPGGYTGRGNRGESPLSLEPSSTPWRERVGRSACSSWTTWVRGYSSLDILRISSSTMATGFIIEPTAAELLAFTTSPDNDYHPLHTIFKWAGFTLGAKYPHSQGGALLTLLGSEWVARPGGDTTDPKGPDYHPRRVRFDTHRRTRV